MLRDVRQQLALSQANVQAGNPELYHDLALYLQVLRHGLLNSVQQACFHLSTQIYPDRYCNLPADQRGALQQHLITLVQQTSSLLTVEHLAQLADQRARERQHQQLIRQQEWLAELGRAAEPPGEPDIKEPEGSVRLDLDPPLQSSWQEHMSAWFSDPSLPTDPAVLDRQFSEAAEAHEMAVLAGLHRPTNESEPSPSLSTAMESGLLPVEAIQLLRWLETYERALARRLRQLSHAINLELLRLGVTSSLLPLSLLQAATQGQLEPLPAPPNLLRVQVPVSPDGHTQIESVALLLRQADLELDLPPLRTCRNRLQRKRQEIRRMAEQNRRLQRRLQTLEAERLWFHDNPRPQTPRD